MVVYIASWLASKGDQIRDVTYGLVPFGVLIGVVAGLIVAQPDLGTARVEVPGEVRGLRQGSEGGGRCPAGAG